MPTYTFQEVRHTKTVRLKCPCGKRFQRSYAATQTVNPFNKNTDGTVKTYSEILREVIAEANAWTPGINASTCPGCGAIATPVQPRPPQTAAAQNGVPE